MSTKQIPCVRYIYKCRRCGTDKVNTESSAKSAYGWLLGALYNTAPIPNQPALALHELHDCGDGGVGIADLVGYEPIEEWELK